MKTNNDIPTNTYAAVHVSDSVDCFFPNSGDYDIKSISPDVLYHITYFRDFEDRITTSGDIVGVLDPDTKTYELIPEPIHVTFFANDPKDLGLDKDGALLAQGSLQEAEDNLDLTFGYSKNFNHIDGNSLAASLEELSESSVQQL